MMDSDDAPIETMVSSEEWEHATADAWSAYEDLLNALRHAVHFESNIESLDLALDSLFKLGEIWTMISQDDKDTRLPFRQQSEIDLVSTLIRLASYTSPFDESFSQLHHAFCEIAHRCPPPANSFVLKR
jgi:hypothetical protein